MARARAANDPTIDYLIEREDLDAWLDAEAAHPDVFDGLHVGVRLPDVHVDVATLMAELRRGRDVSTLTPRERAAMQRDGAAAALLDELAAARDADQPEHEPSPCASLTRTLAPADGELVVHLACVGVEPAVRPSLVTVPPGLDGERRVAAALAALDRVDRAAAEVGLYSVVDGPMQAEVTLVGADVFVDVRSRLDGYAESIARSTIFLQQVANTVFANASDAAVLHLSLRGSCADFWDAMGGAGCHAIDRADTNQEVRR
ncbi:MAG: hypothetical protein R3249_09245 [Nitriliruptorales bacterium]|nr:hypothetical protein [Nitriliruptorales bacterium]